MPSNLITSLQLFTIGFSFGIVGPCFLSCTPILLTYIAAADTKTSKILGNIFIFLSGRLLAYLILGCLAGASSAILNRFLSSHYSAILKPLGGLISIILGVFILLSKKSDNLFCKIAQNRLAGFSNIFVLGFIVGISPCAPLITLLFEIALISKTALSGFVYALSFGLGVCLSSFIVVGILAKVFSGIAARFFKSRISDIVFKLACAFLLIVLGIYMMLVRG